MGVGRTGDRRLDGAPPGSATPPGSRALILADLRDAALADYGTTRSAVTTAAPADYPTTREWSMTAASHRNVTVVIP